MRRERPEDNKYFHYYNANPKQRDVKDCSFRAMSLFLDKSWEEIARMSAENYLKNGGSFELIRESKDESERFSFGEHYLFDEAGCEIVWKPTSYRNNTVRDFIDTAAEEDEMYFVQMKGHCTVVKNKQVWDTFDCSGWVVLSVIGRHKK